MNITVTVVNEHRDRVDIAELLAELVDNNGAREWSRHRLCVELADLIDADVIEDITASTPPVETVEVDVTISDAEWTTWAEMVSVPALTPGPGQRDIFGGEHQ